MSASSWEPLGQVVPRDLTDARLQLHHAAQLVAAVGSSLLESRPDDSHPNLGWLAEERVLAGHAVPGEHPVRAALRPADLTLLLLDADRKPLDALALAGVPADEGLRWLSAAVERRCGRSLPGGLARPAYDIPPHLVGAGRVFEVVPEELEELARWFANAASVLEPLAARLDGASEVRCWPHHLDLATLIAIESGPDGSPSRTVGIGFSPGDDAYPEPYWCVTPWPYPDASVALPGLDAGFWHREGFTAAILCGTQLLEDGAVHTARRQLERFLDAGLAATRAVLGH